MTKENRTESTASIIQRTQRCAEAKRHDYRNDGIIVDGKHRFSIDLNLNSDDLISLSLALKSALGEAGIGMMHEEIVSNTRTEPFHPISHLGRLVDLYRRVDAALHGRKTWNSGR